jgi:hypothetical protein
VNGKTSNRKEAQEFPSPCGGGRAGWGWTKKTERRVRNAECRKVERKKAFFFRSSSLFLHSTLCIPHSLFPTTVHLLPCGLRGSRVPGFKRTTGDDVRRLSPSSNPRPLGPWNPWISFSSFEDTASQSQTTGCRCRSDPPKKKAPPPDGARPFLFESPLSSAYFLAPSSRGILME